MSKIAKTNPKMLDEVIDYIQDELERVLAFENWENNHRAYKTPIANERLFKAEVYGGNGNYKECFFDDYFNATSFFIEEDNAEMRNGKINQSCSFIFQCKLNALYPEIEHRADQELRADLLNVFMNLDDRVSFDGFDLGIDNVYREFDKSNLKYHDFGDFHVIRINFTARFSDPCFC